MKAFSVTIQLVLSNIWEWSSQEWRTSQTQPLWMHVLVIFIHVTLLQTICTSPSNMSYSFVAAALNSRTHYAYGTATNIMQDVREAFEYMVDTETWVAALQEADHYRQKQGTFLKDLVQKMVYDSNTYSGMFLIVHLHSSLLIGLHSPFSLSFTLQYNGGLCLVETHLPSKSYH
jgi:hypothetical protein